MSKGGRTTPTPEDLKLWHDVIRSIAPLGERSPTAAEPDLEQKKAARARRLAADGAKSRPHVPALGPIDRRTVSRLKRGIAAIDARIDLHGLTQAAAHGRLLNFLHEAQANGAQVALVITGKGRTRDDDNLSGAERGVLRRMVPMWLSAAELRPYVVGFGEAGPAHGGAGALYVRIRRKR